MTSTDPCTATATAQLAALTTEHMRRQDSIVATLKKLAKENEILQERVGLAREALQEKSKQNSQALQNKFKEDMKALQIEGENGARDIQFKIQDLNECTQERNQKYFDAQRKIIAEYQKVVQKS